MLIKLIEVTNENGDSNSLREVYINSSHIISVSDTPLSNQPTLKENLGLSKEVRFSILRLSEGNTARTLTVIGTPFEINNKIKKRQLLRG